jgi:hypothetical protein
MKAVEQGIARRPCTYAEELERASTIIRQAREMTRLLMDEGFIPPPPENQEEK